MAIGKHRSNKRSSGNSYTSTVITVVFIAVCIIGAWMFTSNSFVSPQKNTRTTIFDHLTSESGDVPLKFPTTPAFEDNPGDLPNDAIKLDENQDANEGQNSQPEDHNSSEEDSLGVSTGNEEESVGSNDTNDNNETNDNNDNLEAGNDNNDEHKQDLVGENDNKDPDEKAAVVEENPHGLQGKVSAEEEEKLQEHHIQISEESDMTHQQVQELIKIDDHDQNEPIEKNPGSGGDQESNAEMQEKDQESSTGSNKMEEENQTDDNQSGEGTGTTEDVKDHISDEEQETRMENQQHQEEDQSQGGETSEEQVQHDEEAPIESHSIAEETKAQLESIEGQHSGNQDIQEKKEENSKNNSSSGESFAIGESSSEIPKESKESKKAWSTQADQSENQKEREGQGGGRSMEGQDDGSIYGYTWLLCNEKAGADFIPCLDNEKAIAKLHGRNHYEHRERHCPEESPTCLVPLPQGYKTPIEWPQSRDKIWYHNVPHTTLANVKGHQNWVKLTGEFLTFPGGGTQFIHGALHYIDFVQEAVPEIAWGKHTRVVLDVGCGVASFGGYLFDRGVLTMSLAPKDEHEAQVQFALERGIPAISAVMGTQRLQFPSRVFDLIHCARCRVPWHIEGGKLLLELNRLLRPGGYFVWSATPVYQTLEEDVQIWKEMSNLTVSMCWELVTIKKDKINSVGAAIYHKPDSNECYEERKKNQPPMCKPDDDPNAAWYIPLQACMHRLPVEQTERGVQWPDEWPRRLQTPPYWLNKSQMGIYGKPAPDDFAADYEHWQRVVSKSYMKGLGISWSNVRNVMDMRAVYGGFAAALKDLKVWVMNVVNIDSPDTLPIIYERGLFGIYHDWCESFSTYPRTYDLLHADHLFSKLKKRCKLAPVMTEVDRIARPGGKLIVRDESGTVGEVENLLKSLHWEIHLTFSNNQEAMLSAQKTNWRPEA